MLVAFKKRSKLKSGDVTERFCLLTGVAKQCSALDGTRIAVLNRLERSIKICSSTKASSSVKFSSSYELRISEIWGSFIRPHSFSCFRLASSTVIPIGEILFRKLAINTSLLTNKWPTCKRQYSRSYQKSLICLEERSCDIFSDCKKTPAKFVKNYRRLSQTHKFFLEKMVVVNGTCFFSFFGKTRGVSCI